MATNILVNNGTDDSLGHQTITWTNVDLKFLAFTNGDLK